MSETTTNNQQQQPTTTDSEFYPNFNEMSDHIHVGEQVPRPRTSRQTDLTARVPRTRNCSGGSDGHKHLDGLQAGRNEEKLGRLTRRKTSLSDQRCEHSNAHVSVPITARCIGNHHGENNGTNLERAQIRERGDQVWIGTKRHPRF